MKEDDKKEEHSSSKELLDVNKISTLKTNTYIELEDKNPSGDKDISSFRSSDSSQSSFTKALLNKVKKEEELSLIHI